MKFIKSDKNKNKLFNDIIQKCDKLKANETLVVSDFGEDRDSELVISKALEFKGDRYNFVEIHTMRNNKWVDGKERIGVKNGALLKELERIWFYRNLTMLKGN